MTRPEVYVREVESPLTGGNQWLYRVSVVEFGHAYNGWFSAYDMPQTYTDHRRAREAAERLAVSIGGTVDDPPWC